MDTTLLASTRSEGFGKGFARKIRSEGLIPAAVYAGGGDAIHISIDPIKTVRLFQETQNRNTIVKLKIDGKVTPCLVRSVERHPVSRALIHVDFNPLKKGQVVEVPVPVVSSGKAVGEELGGRIRTLVRSVNVRCDYTKIPEAVQIDVTSLAVGDFAKISSATPVKGVEIVFDHDFNVLTCYGASALKEEEEVEPEVEVVVAEEEEEVES